MCYIEISLDAPAEAVIMKKPEHFLMQCVPELKMLVSREHCSGFLGNSMHPFYCFDEAVF